MKGTSVEIWSECIRQLLFNFKTKTTLTSLSNSSRNVLTHLKEHQIRLWKLNAIKKLVRFKRNLVILKSQLNSWTNSWACVKKQKINQNKEKHTDNSLKPTPKMAMSCKLSSIWKILSPSQTNHKINQLRLMHSWSLVFSITKRALSESPLIVFKNILNWQELVRKTKKIARTKN